MYMSGLLMSSRGGRYHPSWPPGPGACLRDHGLCLHGNSTTKSLFNTYEFVTWKYGLSVAKLNHRLTYP